MGQSVCLFDIPSDTAVCFAQLQMFSTGWAKGKKWTPKSLFENNMSFLDSLQEIQEIGEKASWGGPGLKLGAATSGEMADAISTSGSIALTASILIPTRRISSLNPQKP